MKRFFLAVIFLLLTATTNVRAQSTSSSILPPLLRTTLYSTGRAISYSKEWIPSRIKAGAKIRWQIYGVGQLRGNASGTYWGTSFIHTLASDRIPRALLKAQGSGRITISLYEVSTHQLILERKYTFFKMIGLTENQQVANHLPSHKLISKRYLSDRQALTLYVATEPESDNVELTLKTDLYWAPSEPKYHWMVFVYSSNSTNYVAGGIVNGDGTASVKFSPVSRGEKTHYEIAVGVDQNGDGVLSLFEYRVSSPVLEVMAIADNSGYVNSAVELTALKDSVRDQLPFSSFLLSVFLRGIRDGNEYPGGDDAMQNEMSIIQDSLSASDSRLTHVAGARFDSASGWATMSRFKFISSSYVAHEIYKSKAFNQFLNKQANKAESMASSYADSPNPQVVGPFSTYTNWSASPDPKAGTKYDGTSIKFDTQWEPINFTKNLFSFDDSAAVDNDLWNAIGHAMVSGQVTAYVIKQNGVARAQKVAFSGLIEDPYDFDYEGEIPAPTAATLQIGWRSSDTNLYTNRKSGKLWITQVDLNCIKAGGF